MEAEGQSKTPDNKDVKPTCSTDAVPWRWAIVTASFVVHFLAVSAAHKSFGVLYVEFKRKFAATSQSTSWISAIAQFLSLALGPLGGLVATKLTARMSVCIGAVIMSLGFILSMFAPNLEYLYFSYGIVVGFGTALVYSPTVSILGQYFEKRRALANGLGAAGAGVGSFVVPPLLTLLIENYSLGGTLLIMAALMLNIAVAGSLLRPLENNLPECSGSEDEQPEQIQNSTAPDKCSINDIVNPSFNERDTAGKIGSQGQQQGSNRTKYDVVTVKIYDTVKIVKSHNDVNVKKHAAVTVQNNVDVTVQNNDDVTLNHHDDVTVQTPPTFSWSVVRQPVVYVMGISAFLLWGSLPVITMFLPAYGVSVGLSEQRSALLLSISGAGDLVGRVGLGCVADYNLIPKRHLYVLGSALAGASSIAMLHVSSNYAALVVLCFSAGIGAGNVYGLLPVILADELGAELLPSAFSIITVYMGTPFLITPALGGYLEDVTGSWDATFYLAGLMTLAGSVVPLFLKCCRGGGESSTEGEAKIKCDVPTMAKKELTQEVTKL